MYTFLGKESILTFINTYNYSEMSNVKYRVREYNPTANQSGTHSHYAETVINNEIDNVELAQKIAARTGFKPYECQAIVAAIADIVSEEVLESNRISLANEKGTKMLSIYPKVSGSVSDNDILRETTAAHAVDPSVVIRNKAEESDLTPDRLSWTLGSTVGIKFSKEFALAKQAKKVKVVATDTVIPADPGTNNGGGNHNPNDNGELG